ncbi:hypothetical protein [Streptomyces sp. NPDC015131]|uniref:hypothetical protein n=1 Tax=Streptomyces sp. NPDC015131 TaxID=3364941 RepID=UPI0036FB2FDA
MPRGRHRHSPPLHRLLPPSAVAGTAVLCAGGAWLLADPVALRVLVAAAAAAAVTGAVLMRSWDRAAGRRVAELTRARAGDQWRTEERLAELETDLEESRELRAKLDAKLRAKRVELAALRGEHAELLRRYATAETERAGVLESRRRLALEAAGPTRALPAASSTPTPAAYARAAEALANLARGARAGEAGAEDTGADRAGADNPQGKLPAVAGRHDARPPAASPARPAPRVQVGFDYFGTGGTGGTEATGTTDGPVATGGPGSTNGTGGAGTSAADEDLADVVGEEALAVRRRENRAVGKVIDLTAHDETEQIDMVELRRGAG